MTENSVKYEEKWEKHISNFGWKKKEAYLEVGIENWLWTNIVEISLGTWSYAWTSSCQDLFSGIWIAPVKSGYQENDFLISQWKHICCG